MKEVFRKEKKFLINQVNFKNYLNLLEKTMIQDPHNGADGYNIRSLYFDTLNDKDYSDKEDGVRVRRKIRLRIYDPNQNFAILEIKQKDGDNQLKRSLKLNKEDAIKLINGKFDVLLKYPEKFAAECYAIMQMGCYRPKTIIEYKRKAFIAKENNIRVTFDFDIRTNECYYNIFDPNLIMNNAFSNANVVLEVKFDGFLLSYIKEFLKIIDKSEISVSKYCLGRKITKHYEYM